MRKAVFWKTSVMLVLTGVLAGSPASAQRGRGQGQMCDVSNQGGRGQGRGVPMYDPASEVRVTGKVQEIVDQEGRMGSVGIHVYLQTEEGNLEVHLGPSDYLAERNFSLNRGDRVEITGLKITRQGNVLIAREVKRGDEVLVLRDEQGRPVWAGTGPVRPGPKRY